MATVDLPSSTRPRVQSTASQAVKRLKIRLRSLRQRRQTTLSDGWSQISSQLQDWMRHLQELQVAAVIDGDAARDEAGGSSQMEDELRGEIEILEEQIRFLSNEVEVLRQSSVCASEHGDAAVECWRKQLEGAQREASELRMQNSDLADQLARQSLSANIAEKLTWEERKQKLLEQLEADSTEGATSHRERLDMEELLQKTDHEIERRDTEIAELRKIVAEQSSAHQGLAVGAAGIAQFLETDDLIQLEREKLRDLQLQWEQKLRDSEIELSRERARLARERLELDIRQNSLPANIKPTEGSDKTGSTRGNWLARLGLKEQN